MSGLRQLLLAVALLQFLTHDHRHAGTHANHAAHHQHDLPARRDLLGYAANRHPHRVGNRAHDGCRDRNRGPPRRRRARVSRAGRGRPRRLLRVEHRASPGLVLCGTGHRTHPPHGEHPVLPGADRVLGEPRRGRGAVRRPGRWCRCSAGCCHACLRCAM
jgi:hypothetical protein